jgi:acetolactate synthase-1/3 small subunit
MLHTFVALVQDKPGVLTRVASLFRRLSINIVSLTVGESERPDASRMTIVCEAHENAGHRIKASLYKLETTIHVDDVNRSEAVVRELCLIKVAAGPGVRDDDPNAPHGHHSRSHVFELAQVFRARVVDLAPDSIMLEMTGSASKIEGLVQVMRESGYTILEISRTGRMAMRRGQHTPRVLKALGSPALKPHEFPDLDHDLDPDALDPEETIPNAFDE